jgi:hypothetical protein
VDGTGAAARFRWPAQLFLDSAGTLWVADTGNHLVRKVTPAGVVTTAGSVPTGIRQALGGGPAAAEVISAYGEGAVTPAPTSFRLGRTSPSAVVRGWTVFGDEDNGVLMGRRGAGPPVLLAGRRNPGPPASASEDGQGHRAGFAAPSGVAAAADGTVFVADYEGNRIRRLRLPDWLLNGEEAPARRRREWRMPRGS